MGLPSNIHRRWGVDLKKPSSAGGSGCLTISSWLEAECPGREQGEPPLKKRLMPQKVKFGFTHDNSCYEELDPKGKKPEDAQQGSRQNKTFCGCTYSYLDAVVDEIDDDGTGICFRVCFRWRINCSGINVNVGGQAGGKVNVGGVNLVDASGNASGSAGVNESTIKNCVRVCLSYDNDESKISISEAVANGDGKQEIPSAWLEGDNMEDITIE